MRAKRTLSAFATALLLLCIPGATESRVYIDIDAPTFQKLPIAVAAVVSSAVPAATGDTAATVAGKLASYLEMTGFFSIVRGQASPGSRPETGFDSSGWKALGAEYLATVSLSRNGRDIAVEGRLMDVVRGDAIIGKRYTGREEDRERITRLFAGEILTALTGGVNIFTSHIAFVQRQGRSSEICRVSFTGSEFGKLTNYRSLTLSPRFSPDGRYLSYTSYREGNPQLYIRELATGRIRKLFGSPGITLPGAWSADGKKMLFSSNRDGNAEIYVFHLETGRFLRLTHNGAIDISPVWSPDGTKVAFVSSRSGSPQVYVMNGDGSNVRRLTYQGSYNSSPAWSPAGNKIAYEGRAGGVFHIFTISDDGSNTRQLTSGGGGYESPVWSPDGRYLAFSGRRGGKSQIHVMNANGTNMRTLYEAREQLGMPAWSPPLK